MRGLALTFLLVAACAPVGGTVLVRSDGSAEGGAAFDASAPPAAQRGDASASDGTALEAAVAEDAAPPTIESACRIAGASSGFFEEFTSATLDGARFLLAHGGATIAGRTPHGGFLRENVALRDGALVLSVRGDAYAGALRGFAATGARRADGRRTAAAVATRDLFASATYSATFLLRAPPGVEVGLFVLRDAEPLEWLEIASRGGELAGRVRMRSARADGSGGESELALPASADALHSLRFDWYTNPREAVRFWIDDVPQQLSDQPAPEGRAGRLWLLAWVPDDAPADFDTAELRIERAFITPFGNDGDRCVEAPVPPPLTLP